MSNSVLKLSAITIEKMKEHYHSCLQPATPPGSIFVAKPPGCTITAYKSGKVLFQGKTALDEAYRWENVALPAEQKKAVIKTAHLFAPPENIEELSIIGSDEVGTGDYFGPITVVAAYVKKEQMELLRELGVKDSKHLTDKQIVSIAKDLLHTIPYSLLVLRNEKYNSLQEKGMSQGKMKAVLHNKALLNVMQKLEGKPLDGILVDQFCEPAIYFNHIAREKEQVKEKIYFATKAESLHLSVAAASILARYSFIKEMDKIGDSLGMTIPKGAGAQVDVKAAELIRKFGKEKLREIAKLHFANTKKAEALASGKRW